MHRLLLKIFIGLGICVHALAAYALDLKPDPSRLLSDPAYLPKANQFISTTNYSYTRTTGDVYDYQGSLTNSFVGASNALSQSYSYGLNDNVTLRITVAYGMNRTTRDHSTGLSTTSIAYGLDDPVLGVIWRMLDQNEHLLNWDIYGSYAPDLVQAIAASATQDGSVAQGGLSATLGSALSYKTVDFTAYFYGNATYLSKRSVSDNINTITNYDPNWRYSLGMNSQVRISNKFAINAGLSKIFHNRIYGINETTLNAFDENPGNPVIVNAAFVYSITPNKLVTTLNFDYGFYSDSSTNFAANTLLNTTTNGKSSNSIGARLQYMFD